MSQIGQSAAKAWRFAAGAMVLVSLANPREKFWGVLLQLSPAGLSVRGLDLDSFEDFISRLRSGEPAEPSEVFFPMHRVQRMEIDSPNGHVPSIAERFRIAAGDSAAAKLGLQADRSVRVR